MYRSYISVIKDAKQIIDKYNATGNVNERKLRKLVTDMEIHMTDTDFVGDTDEWLDASIPRSQMAEFKEIFQTLLKILKSP